MIVEAQWMTRWWCWEIEAECEMVDYAMMEMCRRAKKDSSGIEEHSTQAPDPMHESPYAREI